MNTTIPQNKYKYLYELENIPENWDYVRLKYLISEKITDGPHETPEFLDEGIPFLSVDSVQNGKLIFEDCRYISEEDHKRYLKKSNPEKDDLLLGKAASIGKIAIINTEKEFNIWSPLALIKPNNNIVHSKFLYYSFLSNHLQYQIVQLSNSNTQYNLAMSEIPELVFSIPSFGKQRVIADFLDYHTARVNMLIEKQERLIDLLEEKRNALIAQAVTKGLVPNVEMKDSGVEWLGQIPAKWKIMKIKHIATINDDTLPESTDPDFEIEYVDIGNVDRIEGILDTEHMKFNKSPSRARRIVKDGDIIVSTVRTYLKSITPIKDPSENLIVSTGFAVIRPNEQIKSEYAGYLFVSPYFVDKVVSHSKGISYPAINVSTLESIEIPLPTLFEQEKIANFLTKASSQIDSLVSRISNLLEYLKEYRITLISFAVSGKIDVRNWNEKEFVDTE